MGYLTTIVIYNDALHTFEEFPEEFAKTILEGIKRAQIARSTVNCGFKGYCNYIKVHPSRHADDEAVLLHAGNEVINLNSRDFDLISNSDPEFALECLNKATKHVEWARRKIKDKIKEKHEKTNSGSNSGATG
jgi:hypothetical protein